MNRILKKVALLSFILISAAVYGQGAKDIRINEIMVNNENSYQDSYGHREGWIELHNTGYSDVNIAGCHIVLYNGKDSVSYKIPKNDPATVINPQGYAVFFTEGASTKGTFFTNFKLEDGNKISFFDQSGKGVALDVMTYNPQMKPDVSKGWMMNEDRDMVLVDELSSTTPNATNNTIELPSRADIFRVQDPNGFAMALTAMSVVFSALLFLFLIFKSIGKAFMAPAKKSENAAVAAAGTKKVSDDDISSEIIAAIAVALKKYNDDMQDAESNVVTINRVAKAYSPWSSKIYGLRQMPQKK